MNERLMNDALGGRPEISALACIDLHSGLVVSAAVRDGIVGDTIESAAACAAELCQTPTVAADETFFVGREWMHVLVRAPERPEIVVVGVAPAAANLALLASTTRDVARGVRR